MVHALNSPKSLIWGLVLLCLPALLPAQGFIRSIAMNPFNADIQPLPATGGYLLASRIYDGSTPTMVFMELDSFCRTQATYGLATTEELEVLKLVPLSTGNFAALGSGSDTSGAIALSYLVNAQGNPSNLLIASAGLVDYWVDGVGLPGGGFVAVGSGFDSQNGYSLLAGFDALGDTTWTRKLTISNEFIEMLAVDLLPGGDLIACGSYNDGQSQRSDIVLARFTAAGGLTWIKRYPANTSIYPTDITLSGTKVFVAGSTEDTANSVYHMGLAAFDTAGNLIWGTELGGYDDAGASRVVIDATGDPLLLGYHDTLSFYNATIASINNVGSLQWARSYDLHGEAYPLTALPLSNDRYLLMVEESSSSEPIHLIETGPDGIIFGPCNSLVPAFTTVPMTMTAVPLAPVITSGMTLTTAMISPTQPTIDNLLDCEPVAVAPSKDLLPAQIVPHPMHTSARLILPLGFDTEGATLQVTDLAGRTVDLTAQRSTDGFALQRNGLPAGLYGYQVLQGGKLVASGKLVLE